jgi:dienelactone hydrolase
MMLKNRLGFGGGALGLLLLAACSAGGSEAPGEDAAGGGDGSGANGGVMAPLPPASTGTNGSTPAPSGSGVSTPPTLGSENKPAPVGIDPGGNTPPADVPNTDDTETTVGETETDPVTPGVPSDVDALIRGADPTLESATKAGPFDVQTVTTGLRDGPGYGTQTLFVPTGAEPPFASVAIVPGFVSPESSIRAWGPFLASHGIVALTIGTNGGGDSPDVRAAALMDALETLKAENARAGGPLEAEMDLTRLGVMGWSMGGGGTLIAANAHPELRAAVSMAAWSPGVQFAKNEVPTLMLAGSADTLAGGQSQGFFASMPEATPKMLFEVAGGAHSVANDPASANGEIGRYGLSWLKVFLEGDERYRQFLLQTPTTQSDFEDNL